MARTEITPVRITIAGVAPSAGAAGDVANGNVVEGNDGERLFVVVSNTSESTAYDVTFVTPGTVGQAAYAVADKTEEIAPEAVEWFGPFPLAEFTSSLQIGVENAALTLSAYRI